MKIEIDINEDLIESMYNKYCNSVECVDCKCDVLPGEEYAGCYDKYKKEYFRHDIQNQIKLILENY